MTFVVLGPMVLLIGAAVLIGGYLLISRLMKKQDGDEKIRSGTLLGCAIGTVILIGIGAGLYKLSNLPFNKHGAIALEATTELNASSSEPETLDYRVQSYRGALVVDIQSLRVVLPDRLPTTMFLSPGRQWGTIMRGTGDWAGGKRTILVGMSSTVSINWAGNDSGNTITVAIDEVIFTIDGGIATIAGVEVPATGPLQVVFLDPLGGFEEVRSTVPEETAKED